MDAWAPDAAADIDADGTIAILGTGLTMIDLVTSFGARGHRGRIVALSRRGLLPQAHAAVRSAPLPASIVPFGTPVSRLLHWVRLVARDRAAAGGDWRSTVDALRPHTVALWRAMSVDERLRFLRHLRPWWDVHRHRMAPAVAEMIGNLVADGRLVLRAGKVVDIERRGGMYSLRFRRRGADAVETIEAARVIDATGLPVDPRASANPVIGSLFASGLARLEPLGIGLDIADDFALVDARGRPSDRIFAVGPLGRGAFWEIVAIPDIRMQCAVLAEDLAERLRRRRQRLRA